ncbi:MAG: hypothetical protein ABI680_00950 [Chthoniobacteraceae bacterium]
MTGPRTARAAAYRWNPEAQDAALIEDGSIVPLPENQSRRWFSPGPETQVNLDATVIGFLLPVSPRQIRRGDQIADWKRRGWLDAAIESTELSQLASLDNEDAPLELRVRSFLDVNCASCHRPGGPSRGNFDARLMTPLSKQGLIDGALVAGDLGISGARVIVPSDPTRSVLLQRLQRHDQFRMPPVALNDEAPPVIQTLEAWIRSLSSNLQSHRANQ